MSNNESSEIIDRVLMPTAYDPNVKRYTDPFYKMTANGEMIFRDTAVAKLFRDTTAGSPEEVQKLLADEGCGGVMKRILTDDQGVLRAAILAKAMKLGMEGKGNLPWLRFAYKVINTSIEEGSRANGGNVPVSAGLAIQVTGPIERILRSVEGSGD